MINDPWLNENGEVVQPHAPPGGGGPGFFRWFGLHNDIDPGPWRHGVCVIPKMPRSSRPPSFHVDGGQVPACVQSMAGRSETVPRVAKINSTFQSPAHLR